MCAATVAVVAGVAGTAASVGGSMMAQHEASKGGGSTAPKVANVPGFGPATGLQSYSARLLAQNRGVKVPGILDWAGSGGTLRPDWRVPDFTPREAEQLHLVEKGTGKPIATFNPETEGSLSLAGQAQLGAEKIKAQAASGHTATGPQAGYSRSLAREEMLKKNLAAGGLRPGKVDRLTRQLGKVTARRAVLEKKLGG